MWKGRSSYWSKQRLNSEDLNPFPQNGIQSNPTAILSEEPTLCSDKISDLEPIMVAQNLPLSLLSCPKCPYRLAASTVFNPEPGIELLGSFLSGLILVRSLAATDSFVYPLLLASKLVD